MNTSGHVDEHADRDHRQTEYSAHEPERGLQHRPGTEQEHLRQRRRAEDETDQQGAGETVLLPEHFAQDDRGDAAEQADDRESRECAERAREDEPPILDRQAEPGNERRSRHRMGGDGLREPPHENGA